MLPVGLFCDMSNGSISGPSDGISGKPMSRERLQPTLLYQTTANIALSLNFFSLGFAHPREPPRETK